MKQRKPRPMQGELTGAMHREFTVDAQTDRQHRLASARSSVRLGMCTAAQAAKAYGFSPTRSPFQIRTPPRDGLAE